MRISGLGLYDPLGNVGASDAASQSTYKGSVSNDKVIISDNDIPSGDTASYGMTAGDNDRTGRDLNEIAFRLKTYDGFNNIDRIGGIKTANADEAVLDLEMDETLAQYQYFVGENPVINDTEDGVVIQKSGFQNYN